MHAFYHMTGWGDVRHSLMWMEVFVSKYLQDGVATCSNSWICEVPVAVGMLLNLNQLCKKPAVINLNISWWFGLTSCHSTSCSIVLALHQRKVSIAQVINLQIICNGIYHTAAEEHEVRSSLSVTERLRTFSLHLVGGRGTFQELSWFVADLQLWLCYMQATKG